MKNNLDFGVSEVARVFEVNRDAVKTWGYHFAEYLSPQANPKKGAIRKFTLDDIRVLAYIFMDWEDEPDIEAIKYGLNSGNQWDIEPIDNLILSLTPIFQKMPENIDESWRGVVFGGEFQLSEIFETANSFKLAGDHLVEIAHENYEERELFQPALYSYRHAIELYLKAFQKSYKTHNLENLQTRLSKILKDEYNAFTPPWFNSLIESFQEVDPKSTSFRYGIVETDEELYVDLKHLKIMMNWLSVVFQKIMLKNEND